MKRGGVTGAVYAEQIGAVFRQMPIAVCVNFANGALTATVLAPVAARPLPLLWLGILSVVTIGRGILWLQYRRVPARAENLQCWSMLATGVSLLTGLCWGLGGVLLFPVVPVFGQIFLTIVIGGMSAGAVVVSASHFPTLLAFLLPAGLPMAVRFLAEGSTANTALAAMIVVFVMALAFAGWQLSRIFANAMHLRFELNEANLRLQAEITEHRATEAALHQAQKLEAIGHLTGGIAHDFNNLLTAIIGSLELASMRAGVTSPAVPSLKAALHSAERGVSLIQRLLAFARKQNLSPRSLDVGKLVFGIEDLLRRALGPNTRLMISADPGLAPAYVDANQLELAILNLAINARDAMPQGGTMGITMKNCRESRMLPPALERGDYVVLSVSDNGVGMDEATLEKAFDPFFTTKEIGSGSGLGLPMVQGFVGQSGGAVCIRSKPGEGTTVELWLPQADELPVIGDSGTEDSARSQRNIGPGDKSVLLCDDDDGVRSVLGEFLTSAGYVVHEASGGEAAIRILEGRDEIGLLITDYAMPGLNGLETIRQATSRRRDLRCLLITGHASVPSSTVPILRKPFALDELASRVTEILRVAD